MVAMIIICIVMIVKIFLSIFWKVDPFEIVNFSFSAHLLRYLSEVFVADEISESVEGTTAPCPDGIICIAVLSQ